MSADGSRRAWLSPLWAALTLSCLASSDVRSRDAAADDLVQAELAFAQGAPDAYARFRALPLTTQAGAVARRRLADADRHYTRALSYLKTRDPRARDEMIAGLAVAPLDPAHYRELGRIYRELGLVERSAKYFTKYLQALPAAADANSVRGELEALAPLQFDPLDPAPLPTLATGAVPRLEGPAVWFGALLLAVAASFALVLVTRPSVTLERLIAERPELDVALAYLISALRHEWLKHRIGAVQGLLAALEHGVVSSDQREFLSKRLLRQPHLAAGFRAQLEAFRSALDPRLKLLSESRFRRAADAMAVLEAMSPQLSAAPERRLRKLGAAYRELARFDAYLATRFHALARAQLSDVLVQQAWQQVRGEYSAGAIALGDFHCEAPERALFVRAFVADLLLALKNLLRNAILALGEEPGERKIAVRMTSSLEATGDELVHVRVLDSAHAAFAHRALLAPDLGSGMGLVAAAVARYGGGVRVEAAATPYVKAVVLTLFRADDPIGSEGPP